MEKRFLAIENLTKIYDDDGSNKILALDSLSLSAQEGDFITIVGSNASGKSTLINLIAGSIFPTAGNIILDGNSILNFPEFKRAESISCVKQNPNESVIKSMTIAENLSMAKLRGKKVRLNVGVKNSYKREFSTILKSFNLGLEKRLDEKMSSLSGGQKQIVALLVATIAKPKLLLFDEHTAALDPNMCKTILKFTNIIVQENRLTTLMVTHNIRHAIEYGNRLIILERGKIKLEVSGVQKKLLNIIEVERQLEDGLIQ